MYRADESLARRPRTPDPMSFSRTPMAMRYLPFLVLGLSLAPPAMAQRIAPAQAEALHSLGVPAEALTALFATEAGARALLGRPTSVETFPAETHSGPDFRMLHYTLAAGASLNLTVCTDSMRADLGIASSFTFCEASVSHAVPTTEAWQAFAFRALDALSPVASSSFGECDTDYFVLGDVWASVQFWGERGEYVTAIVLEPAR